MLQDVKMIVTNKLSCSLPEPATPSQAPVIKFMQNQHRYRGSFIVNLMG